MLPIAGASYRAGDRGSGCLGKLIWATRTRLVKSNDVGSFGWEGDGVNWRSDCAVRHLNS